MIAKVTQRTELGPSRGLPTARHARVSEAAGFDPRCALSLGSRATMTDLQCGS
jgi:hypothetical protein